MIECIGHTPLVSLRKIVSEGHTRVIAKLESQNRQRLPSSVPFIEQ